MRENVIQTFPHSALLHAGYISINVKARFLNGLGMDGGVE
jgi:hypoxanthine-guanine phosphoribosyltransferase